jgi:ribosome recycling factor
MTLLILKLSSLIGRLSIQNLTNEQRETILREIQNLIEDYFQGQ